MPTLSTLFEHQRPFKVGSLVVVLDPSDWGGPPAGTRLPAGPYQFTSVALNGMRYGAARHWTDEHQMRVGMVGEVEAVERFYNLLRLTFGRKPDAEWWHPDWLRVHVPAPPPPANECVCPLPALMTRGCTCGQMARERAVA